MLKPGPMTLLLFLLPADPDADLLAPSLVHVLSEVSVLPGPAAVKSQRITQKYTLIIN